MPFRTPSTTDPTPDPEQKLLVPQRGRPIPNVMIDDDLDDPIPRSRSNPTFDTSQRFPNQTQDDTFIPNFPGPSSIFQRAREVDIGGNPSFVNGTLQNVYYYNHDSHVARKQIYASPSADGRRVDIINKLGEEVKELYQRLQEKIEELSRLEDDSNRQAEKVRRLEGEVGKLNQLLQEKTKELSQAEDTVNRNAKQAAEDLKQSNEEVGKLNKLLQEKTDELARVEDASNRQAEKINRLEGEVGKLNQILQEKTVELSSLEEAANRVKGRHENKTKILEENVPGMTAGMNQQETYEKEIRGLQAKVCNLTQDMNQQKAKYEEEIRSLQEGLRFGRGHAKYEKEVRDLQANIDAEMKEKRALESEVARLNHILDERTTALSRAKEAAIKQEQLIHDLSATNQRQQDEIRQMKTTLNSFLMPKTETKVITVEEFKTSNTRDKLYVLLHGKVYDVTKFLDEHPGGDVVILAEAGQDATEAFEDVGHSDEARNLLPLFYIGDIEQNVSIKDLEKNVSSKDRWSRWSLFNRS